MNIALRDELMEKIAKNTADYNAYLEKVSELDRRYSEEFPLGDNVEKNREYTQKYLEKLKELSEEKEKLDDEWKDLNEQKIEMLTSELRG